MFKNQPAGLYVLSLANTGERFGYYTMLAIFLLFLQAKFGFDSTVSGQIYAGFLALVYFMPLIGGWVADRWSFSKCVVTGIAVMFIGYMVMAIPTEIRSTSSLVILCAALLLIAVGTGLFKGNLQVMVGDLYNNARFSGQRDAAFSLFYMAINIGSMFAPMAATAMCNMAMKAQGLTYVSTLPAMCNLYLDGHENAADIIATATEAGMTPGADLTAWASQYITTLTTGYSYGFAVACVSLIASFLIYSLGRKTYAHILNDKKNGTAKAAVSAGPELTPAQTRQRVIALLLVFAVVIFFWMVFHQNGATLTEFAKTCTSPEAGGWTRIGFNVWALLSIAVGVYALFNLFQTKSNLSRLISVALLALVAWAVYYFYNTTPDPLTGIQPQEYQQFNPFYVVALTPVSLAFFGWLAKRKKEPSAPRKIGYGMLMAAIAYGVMCVGSLAIVGTSAAVSPNWLIGTYLLLTFAELLLSPMGISFVSKVAPPKLKGSMMGGWFAATAVGNYLVSIPMLLWGKISTAALWGILIIICLISAAFIFSIMKKLEAATSDAPAADTDSL
ncbi:peptide MFS transporter [Muribaculum intestinale]|uniref:MFS transporter n=3 Tax=Muribaculum intestinale TaxID=1796646 RepID=A0A1B1SAT3_9BACT|nr:peptide MFS transporter [Muribaculum intestinale]GFI67644.1 di-/tripeptide transporter [Muribaculaceae bacterium]ANU63915.1 MFS transporter [Muribaculum intestinale]ASB37993.1 MFS transporter [Muribaculum intestinale]MYM11722.1 MFS transporter [Muribaculum intestinale]PWB04823.1 MFS transporter [Muribaculum intestinale]